MRRLPEKTLLLLADGCTSIDRVMSLNETGEFLYERLKDGASERELTEALCSAYEVEEETASRDVRAFVAGLKEMGFLAGEDLSS